LPVAVGILAGRRGTGWLGSDAVSRRDCFYEVGGGQPLGLISIVVDRNPIQFAVIEAEDYFLHRFGFGSWAERLREPVQLLNKRRTSIDHFRQRRVCAHLFCDGGQVRSELEVAVLRKICRRCGNGGQSQQQHAESDHCRASRQMSDAKNGTVLAITTARCQSPERLNTGTTGL